MKKLKKYFGEYNMSWPKVIIFAVITAVYTALINQVSFLENTSFQDIAINYECWILFAVFIIMNCKKWYEASLKCFVFFLVSQPLIYLIEVPFLSIGWKVFENYKFWFIVTLLTLPGAAIAFLVKKKNLLSVFVLSVATGFISYIAITYLKSTISDFPHHLISFIFCVALAFFLVFVLLDEKKHRIVAVAIILVVLVSTFIITDKDRTQEIILGSGNWSYSIDDSSVVDIEMQDGNKAVITAKHKGTANIKFKDADGNIKEYYATVGGNSVYISEFN